MSKCLVVIGIGQTLRGDDGAGLEAVQLWKQTYPLSANHEHVRVELAELPGVGLLAMLAGAQCAILVDAVRSGAQPGTIHLLSEAEVVTQSMGGTSAHGWGVAETLSLGRKLTPDKLPDQIRLIGIEAGELGMGQPLSPLVTAALPRVASQIEQWVRQSIS